MRKIVCIHVLVALGALSSCADLGAIQGNVCGNGVVDPGEDCDTFDQGELHCRKPGEDQACHFDCSEVEGEARACKEGWGCGPDFVCHEPIGAFASKVSSLPSDANLLLLADFDGDHRQDILTSNEIEMDVHYLSDTGALESTTVLSVGNASPSVGQLTDDEMADIVINAGEGIGVLRGRSDRSFSTTPYASIFVPFEARILGMEVLASLPGDDPVALVKIATQTLLISVDIATQEFAVLFESPYPLENLGDDGLTFGHLSEDPIASPCQEYVFAFTGANEVIVGTPCRSASELNESGDDALPATSVVLPDGVTTTGVRLFDMNDDGHVDLVIGAQRTEAYPYPAYVAYGVGDGTFHSDPFVPAAQGDNHASAYPGFESFPLAVGHLNGDRIPDYVNARSIWVSERTSVAPGGEGSGGGSGGGGGAGGGEGGSSPMPFEDTWVYRDMVPISGEWAEAAVADFDGNGTADVVTTTNNRTGLELFSGTGQGTFNRFAIPTQSVPHHLAVGDYDGDVIADVAFGEAPLEQKKGAAGESESRSDPLSICFGRAGGPLQAPLNMGHFGEILQVASAHFSDASGHVDGISEVGAFSRSKDPDGGDVRSLAILTGSTDRQLQSPFALQIIPEDPAKDDTVPYFPLRSVVGEFRSSDPPHSDVASLAIEIGTAGPQSSGGGPGMAADPTRRLWLSESKGEAELDQATTWYSDALPTDIGGGLPFYEDALVTAIDVDGDGIDELAYLVTLFNREQASVAGGIVVAQAVGESAEGGESRRWVAGAAQTTTEAFLGNPQLLGTFAPILFDRRAEARAVAADIDADGKPDLAAVGHEISFEEGKGLRFASHVVIFWNGGGGDPTAAFDATKRVTVSVPGDKVVAFAAANVDTDPELELVLVSDTAAYIVQMGGAKGRKPGDATLLEGVPGGKAVAAADLTADGIVDLIVGSDDEVGIYPGKVRQ